MNIEESVEYLKNCLNDEYNFKNATRKKDKEAIETLLTAYEKEKDTSHYNQSQLDIANAKLIEEKEKNNERYNEGYSQGVKDERDNTEEHIKERIEELNTERIHFENDNANRIFIRKFIKKYTEKDAHNFGIFNTPEVITYMTNNEYIARISELQELLTPELLKDGREY